MANPTMDKLAALDQNGFSAAIFPEIRNAIARKMQEIYGNDIDLSTASADAQYVNAEALMINNIYRVLESLADGLNPSTASGKYLDILASFSGAFRQQAKASTAQLYIWNTTSSAVTPNVIQCMDKNGNTWTWTNPVDISNQPMITIPPLDMTNYVPSGPYTFTCDNTGPVLATGRALPTGSTNDTWHDVFDTPANERGGDIWQTVNLYNLDVVQIGDCALGQYRESDGSLRSRRNLSFGQAGSTVLNSLSAALRAIEGVGDVLVIPNATGDSISADDGVSVAAHNVYVIVAANPVTINSSSLSDIFKRTIGETIYEQLTPGILTQNPGTSPNGGVRYSYMIKLFGNVSTTIYWKQCSYYTTGTSVRLNLLNNVSELSAEQQDALKTTILNYYNNLKINESGSLSELSGIVSSVDFKLAPYGLPTYQLDLTNSSAMPAKKLTKFYYTNVAFDDDNLASHYYTLNIT